jgi:hypothetical protein
LGAALALLGAIGAVIGVPAHAEGPQVLIGSPPIQGQPEHPPLIVRQDIGSGTITVTNPGGTAPTTQQCVEGVINAVFCLGTSDQLLGPNDVNVGPITISNAPAQEHGLPGTRLDWIIDDAVSSVAAIHGVRADDLVRSYARPEIRAYVAMRINDILNKKLYGIPLSTPEDEAYHELAAIYKQRLVTQAEQSLHEYEEWSKDPCAYIPPGPPAGSGLPHVHNAIRQTAACSAFRSHIETFKFLRETPSVATFDTWAEYRHPSPLTAHSGDARVKAMTAETVRSNVALGAVGGAVAAAAGTIGLVSGLNLALFTNVIVQSFWTVIPETTAVLAAGGVFAVAAGVVFAAAVAGVSIWRIIEDAAPGHEIRRRVMEALNNHDPFGIESAKANYAGLNYSTRQDPDGKPRALIHDPAFTRQLASYTYNWMMFDPSGKLVPDPTVGWESHGATTAADMKFVNDLNIVQDPLVVLAEPGTTDHHGRPVKAYRVKIARGWLLVSTQLEGETTWGPYEPRLNVQYDNGSGEPAVMSLYENQVTGQPPQMMFLETKLGPDGTLAPVVSPTWTLRTIGGAMTTVRLVQHQDLLPRVDVVPSVEGNLTADNRVTLRANLSTPGHGTGGTYTWRIERLDDSGAVADTVPPPSGNLTGFQTRLSSPGRYRVHVSYTHSGTTPVTASGRVEFTVEPPSPTLLKSEIRDDRVLNGSLSLDLRMHQNTPSDTFNVHVDWANDGNGNVISRHYTVHCVNAGFDTCDTGPLVEPEHAPTNSQWSESPTFRIPDHENFLPYVSVHITNRLGQIIKRTFRITGHHRPAYATRTPDVVMPAGVFSRVDVVEIHPSPLLTQSQHLTIRPFVESIAKHLPPGITPDIEHFNGRWFLQLRGTPQADAIGPHTFAFPFEQEPEGSGFRPAPALVTLNVAAASSPGYRSVLRNTPSAFLDRFYRNIYPDYVVQVTQVLGPEQNEFTAFTGTVRCRLTAGPTVIFDKVCNAGAQFPWPTEHVSDTLEASTYLESATQPISADGAYSVGLTTKFDP